VGTCRATLAYVRDIMGEVGLVSGRYQRDRVINWTSSARSD